MTNYQLIEMLTSLSILVCFAVPVFIGIIIYAYRQGSEKVVRNQMSKEMNLKLSEGVERLIIEQNKL